jgi:hypothetical protein
MIIFDASVYTGRMHDHRIKIREMKINKKVRKTKAGT